MRRIACGLVLLATLGGCVSLDTGGPSGGAPRPHYGAHRGPASVPGVQGPYGGPVPMVHPYSSSPPSKHAALHMMQNNIPLQYVQQQGGPIQRTGGFGPPGMGSGLMRAGGVLSPPGLPPLPGLPGKNPIQQTQYKFRPPLGVPPGSPGPLTQTGGQLRFPVKRTQVRFLRPTGMRIYLPQGEDFRATPIFTPGRFNFLQAAVYRLKVTNYPGSRGLPLYPTLEVVPANPKTEEFLSHNAVPVVFSEEDFKQVATGNYLVKVVYLPDPEFQELANPGPASLVSTQLPPGADPIQEARQRGHILLVIRMGNMDQEARDTPAIDAPGPDAQNKGAGVGGTPHPQFPFPRGMQIPYGLKPPQGGLVVPPGYPKGATHGPIVGKLGVPPGASRPNGYQGPRPGFPQPARAPALARPPLPATVPQSAVPGQVPNPSRVPYPGQPAVAPGLPTPPGTPQVPGLPRPPQPAQGRFGAPTSQRTSGPSNFRLASGTTPRVTDQAVPPPPRADVAPRH
ncbi:MAG: hypothetical protein ACFCD0_27450 [Gemmataceae bacterium]